jgi:hypothetical protein
MLDLRFSKSDPKRTRRRALLAWEQIICDRGSKPVNGSSIQDAKPTIGSMVLSCKLLKSCPVETVQQGRAA